VPSHATIQLWNGSDTVCARVLASGFRVSGFWFLVEVSSFGFLVSGFWLRFLVSGFWFRVSGFGL